jgi:hypothetical protein
MNVVEFTKINKFIKIKDVNQIILDYIYGSIYLNRCHNKILRQVGLKFCYKCIIYKSVSYHHYENNLDCDCYLRQYERIYIGLF